MFMVGIDVVCWVVEWVEEVNYYLDIDICWWIVIFVLVMYVVGGIMENDIVMVYDIDVMFGV